MNKPFENSRFFDQPAQERMARDSELLLPILNKYRAELDGDCIEFGPFSNPLLTPERFPNARITFVDADESIVLRLRERFKDTSTIKIIHSQLNENPSHLLKQIAVRYRTVVASQILNYLDLHRFLTNLNYLVMDGATFFINNVIDFGIPEHFHDERPHTDEHLIEVLRRFGWQVIERQSIPSIDDRHQNPRLLLILTKKVT